MGKVNVFWFRRDLRLNDNHGLFVALQDSLPVLPIFIFDTNILNRLTVKKDRRVDFIHQALSHMDQQLKEKGSGIRTFYGDPKEVWIKLLKEHEIGKVFANHDYEPYAAERDHSIQQLLEAGGISFLTFKDQVIFEKKEVTKDDGNPYTIFTPYSRKWKARLEEKGLPYYPSEKALDSVISRKGQLISLKELGFEKTDMTFDPSGKTKTSLLKEYKEKRDFPFLNATSKLSMKLRFGTVSIRDLTKAGLQHSESWLNELIWREFYMMILWNFPHVVKGAFKKEYDRITWRNNEKEFLRWCHGKTGFPIVDAGMRELNETGFMHNRVRMIVSSFLVKDLLIDWRWGEAYFAEKLNDFDLSANNGGWQWAAGTGCDAAPYFRIFNPTEQQKKFDPEFQYIKKWVPEFGTPKYPAPMVDHALARKRTLAAYSVIKG